MNKNVHKYIFFVFIIILQGSIINVSRLSAQTDTSRVIPDTTDLNIFRYQEKLLESVLEDSEDSKLLDRMEYLKSNPLDLNTATRKEIEEVPYMNSITAKKIIDYRNSNGSFSSKRELLKIEGVTQDFYEKVKVFLVAKNSKTDVVKNETGNVLTQKDYYSNNVLKNTDVNVRSRVQQDLQDKQGYINGEYPGSKIKLYNRFTGLYKGRDFSIGANLTVEKDAGETNYADYYSGYLELNNWKFINKVIAGDYTLNFGQGLGLWTSLSYSKGAEAVNIIKKNNYEIDAYRSTNEVQFFRGGAANVVFKNYNFFVFYSDNYFDASVDTTLNELSSIYFDGYHRTNSEQNRQSSSKEQLLGGRVFADYGFLRLGATYWTSKFSKPFNSDSKKQLYSFAGDKANMLSVDYDIIYKNFNLFGEFARSQSSNVAALTALQISAAKFADIIFLYRNYPENFSPVHSFGFGENNGNTYNENGFYAGLSLKPFRNFSVETYFDQFKFPYRTYYNPVPTTGNDFLLNAEYKVSKGFLLYMKYRNKNKEEPRTVKDEFSREVQKIDNRSQTNVRVGFDYDISGTVRIRSRYEYVMVKYDNFGGNNKGFLFFTDVKAFVLKNLSVSTRFIVFQTDDYDSRVYEFEEDLRGVMSNVGLYGNGTRWYILLKYKPFTFVELAAKYSATYYDGVKSIGTGNDMIQGDINNRFNFGLEILF
ncbi:MAG: helix-hairpin-helix domain-containing protein [Candidatus Kapaibacterium sp.]